VKVQKVEMLFRYCTFAIWELFGTNIHISVKNRKKTPQNTVPQNQEEPKPLKEK